MVTLEDAVYQPLIQAENGRVTQGCPALSPTERAVRDYKGRQRIRSRQLQREIQARHDSVTAPDGNRPRGIYDSQRGHELLPHQVEVRLKKLNPNLVFEVSRADSSKLGIYMLDSTKEEGRQYLMAMESQRPMPEFAVIKWRDEARSEALDVVMGWRTVLARLIRKQLISKASCDVLFGLPSRDSQLWQSLTG